MRSKNDFTVFAASQGVPKHTAYMLADLVYEGFSSSSFLEALRANNLMESFATADDMNRMSMKAIVFFMYNHCPSACKHKDWKGLNNMTG